MSEKLEPCCGRLVGRITAATGHVKVAAHKAAKAHEKGRPMARYLAAVDDAKAELAAAKEALANHEAEIHAGVPA